MTPRARLQVKVVPGASREGHDWLDAAVPVLKVRVTAPPEKGKANKAVVKYLAARLGLPAGAVTIVSGSASPQKVIAVESLATADVLAKLATP